MGAVTFARFRGTCSICGVDHHVRRDGKIRERSADDGIFNDEKGNCWGSSKEPGVPDAPHSQH